MGSDRGDSFPFDYENKWNSIWFKKSKGKLSPRSYPIQCERKWKYSFLSVAGLQRATCIRLIAIREIWCLSRHHGGIPENLRIYQSNIVLKSLRWTFNWAPNKLRAVSFPLKYSFLSAATWTFWCGDNAGNLVLKLARSACQGGQIQTSYRRCDTIETFRGDSFYDQNLP